MYLPLKLFKFIFFTLFLINSIFCYDPPKRRFHDSVIIDKKLLIFTGSEDYTYEVFYLDLSLPFNNKNLTWVLIPESLPLYTYRSTAVLSLDNSTIYLYGGFMTNKNTLQYDYSNLVYTFDNLTSTWSPAVLRGDVVAPRQDMKGVIDDSGVIYIFGGFNATNFTSYTGTIYNDMQILNTNTKTWSTLSISKNLPLPRCQYAAEILQNGNIIYFGGLERTNENYLFTHANMNKIDIFDTKTYEWSQVIATGDNIGSRIYFSTVLTPNGTILIFGGSTQNLTSVSPKFAMLDTNNFEWSILSNSKNSPPTIYGHAANLHSDYMIITFGFVIDSNVYNPNVYLYNIKNNTWDSSFVPATTTSNTSTGSFPFNPIQTSPTEKSSNALAIGLGTGIGAAVLISSIVAAVIIVRRRRTHTRIRNGERSDTILEIPSSNRLI